MTSDNVILRDKASLYHIFTSAIIELEDKLKKANIPIYIFETLRTVDRCKELFAQGRVFKDNKWIIVDPKKIVTKSPPGLSMHNYGIAADFVFDGDLVKPGIQWSWADKNPWVKFGKIVRSCPNLTWGGDFKSIYDPPHVELKTKYKASDLKAFYDKGNLGLVWNELNKEFKL